MFTGEPYRNKCERLFHNCCAPVRSDCTQRTRCKTRGFSAITKVTLKPTVVNEGLQLPDCRKYLLLEALINEVAAGPGAFGEFDQIAVFIHRLRYSRRGCQGPHVRLYFRAGSRSACRS